MPGKRKKPQFVISSWDAEFNAEVKKCTELMKEYDKVGAGEIRKREADLKIAEKIWMELAENESSKKEFFSNSKVNNERLEILKMAPKAKRQEEKIRQEAISLQYCQTMREAGSLPKQASEIMKKFIQEKHAGAQRMSYFAALLETEPDKKIALLDGALLEEGNDRVLLRKADTLKKYVGDNREERTNALIIEEREAHYMKAKALYQSIESLGVKSVANREIRELDRWHAGWREKTSVAAPWENNGASDVQEDIFQKISKSKFSFVFTWWFWLLVVVGVGSVYDMVHQLQAEWRDEALYTKTETEDGEKSKARYTIKDGALTEIIDCNSAVLQLPAEIDGESIRVVSARWLDTDGDFAVEELIIPEGVTELGDYAFQGNEGLKKVVLPESLEYIGAYAFADCTNLEEIVMPHNLRVVEEGAFTNTNWYVKTLLAEGQVVAGSALLTVDSLIEGIVIPDGVTTIGARAFEGREDIVELVLPDGLKGIGDNAFAGCSNLVSVTFPESLETIGKWAFYECGSLSRVDFIGSVTTIGECAFQSCGALAEMEFPEGLEEIGKEAFRACDSLVEIDLPGTLKRIGESAFYMEWYASREFEVLEIPEGVEEIGGGAFAGNNYIRELHLPKNSLKKVGNSAFMLPENAVTENGLVMVESLVFSCDGTQANVIIPEGITAIMDGAFMNRGEVLAVSIPEGVKYIGRETFCNCGIQRIMLPDSLEEIGNEAFEGCGNLMAVFLPDSLTTIGDSAFIYCDSLTVIEGGEGLTNVAEGAFGYLNLPEELQKKLNVLWGIESGE